MALTHYVVGFCFRRNNSEVALIRKNKPDWQRGKLNGIGGKIELEETSLGAMCREFQEETGVDTTRADWRWFLTLCLPDARVTFYESRAGDNATLTRTTDEEVAWFKVNEVTYAPQHVALPVVPNLRWLIPLALDETRVSGVMNGQ